MICTVIEDWKLVPLPAALAVAAQLRTSIINSGICTQNLKTHSASRTSTLVSPIPMLSLWSYTFQSSPTPSPPLPQVSSLYSSRPKIRRCTKKIACSAPWVHRMIRKRRRVEFNLHLCVDRRETPPDPAVQCCKLLGKIFRPFGGKIWPLIDFCFRKFCSKNEELYMRLIV
jgi:hypothetical protein